MKPTVLLLVLLATSGQAVAAQSPSTPPQKREAIGDEALRLKTELLEIRAVVTDKQGRIISGLKREDFEVLENGRLQEISFFSKEQVAGSATSEPGEPARPPARAAQPGRTIVLFVDTLHLSTQSLLRVKMMLKELVKEKLTENDLVAVVTSGGAMGLFNQFTRDRRILFYAIEKIGPFQQGRPTNFTPYLASLIDREHREAFAVGLSIIKAEEGLGIPGGMQSAGENAYVRVKARQILAEASYRRRAALSTLEAVAEKMADLPGQRIIAFISDGFTLMGTGGSTETDEVTRAVSRAVRSGVVIYSIDAKGLTPGSIFGDVSLAFNPSPAFYSLMSDSQKELENGINALAKDTGGEAFFNTNDLKGSIQKALDNNRLYYSLSYYPQLGKDNNRLRRLVVRVKNHPEYSVRAQKGYFASDLARKEEGPKTPRQRMVEALTAPLPTTTLGVAATADYLESDLDGSQVSVNVYISGATLDYLESSGRYRFDLEVTTMVFDESGKAVQTIVDAIKGNLERARYELARKEGYLHTKRLALKPGRYQVRVGVREPGTEVLGTAMAWVDVPDLTKKRLTMSSLIIAELSAGREQANPQAADEYERHIEHGIALYKSGNFLIYTFALYNSGGERLGESDLVIQSELLDEGKAVYASGWQPISSRVTGRGEKQLEVGGQLKLVLKPGIYELRVTVKQEKGKQQVQRAVMLEVE